MDNLTQAYATAIQLHQQLEAVAAKSDDHEWKRLIDQMDDLVMKIGSKWARLA